MRLFLRPGRSLAALLAPLVLAACATDGPREVALPATAPAPTEVALDGHGSGGELADARMALDDLAERPAAGHRPDLVAVARQGFTCWEEAARPDGRLPPEATACRADFWGAVHALSRSRTVAAAR